MTDAAIHFMAAVTMYILKSMNILTTLQGFFNVNHRWVKASSSIGYICTYAYSKKKLSYFLCWMTILGGRRMLLIPIDQIYRPCKYRLATKFPDYKTTQSATIKCYLTEDFQTRCLKQNRMVKIMKHWTPSIKFHRYFFTEWWKAGYILTS